MISTFNLILFFKTFLALNIIWQSLEHIVSVNTSPIYQSWSWKNVQLDFTAFPNLILFFIKPLFNDRFFIILQYCRLFGAVGCLFTPLNIYLPMILLIFNILTSFRFRGTYNGGSDFMTIVCLSALCGISYNHGQYEKLAMIYLGIHTLISYLKAGYVKVIQSEWRQGKALQLFLPLSRVSPSSINKYILKLNPTIHYTLCWFIIIWELSTFIVLFFDMTFVISYFTTALLFHLMIFKIYGLNRFFWSWLPAWAGIIYIVQLIHH